MVRTICAGLLAFALAACTPVDGGGNGEEAVETGPPILDLLRLGDIAACAHPAVMSVFQDSSRVSFEEAEKLSLTRDQYDAVEPDDISLKEISTSKANKDIAEVYCQANLYAMGHKVGPVEYAVRPQATGDGIVVWFDETLGGAMELAKMDHMSALKSAVPKAAELIRPAAAADISSTDDTDSAEPSAPAPMTPYEKAQAALGDEPSTSPTGN